MKFTNKIMNSDADVFSSGLSGFGFMDSHRPHMDNGIFGSKSLTKTYYNVLNELEKMSLPFNIQREAENILIKYIKDRKKKKQRVVIKNMDVFIDTLLYYAYSMNDIRYRKPKKFHRDLRSFIRSHYGNVLNKKMIEKRNRTFYAILERLGEVDEETENYLYTISYIIDNVFWKKYEVVVNGEVVKRGIFTRNTDLRNLVEEAKSKYGSNATVKVKNIVTITRVSLFGAVLLRIFEDLGINHYELYKKLGIATHYSRKILEQNRDVIDDGLKIMSEKDKEMLYNVVRTLFS